MFLSETKRPVEFKKRSGGLRMIDRYSNQCCIYGRRFRLLRKKKKKQMVGPGPQLFCLLLTRREDVYEEDVCRMDVVVDLVAPNIESSQASQAQ